MTDRQHQRLDSQLHHALLEAIVASGTSPGVDGLAARLAVLAGDVEAGLDRLAEDHGLVLHPGTHEVAVVHPFSLVPTATWVAAARRGWWAPCPWCALGIAALVEEDTTIHLRLGGEAEALAVEVRAGAAPGDRLVVHFAIPPRDAWKDVHRFCATVLAFAGEADVDDWCRRHGMPRGPAVPLATVAELARRWYGRHRAIDWRKWTPAEAQEIFAGVGLTGEFWEIPQVGERF